MKFESMSWKVLQKLVTILTLTIAVVPLSINGQTTGGTAVLSKPFMLAGSRAALGGYFDHELRVDYDVTGELTNISFVPHRLVPFIYAEIASNLVFSTEIDFEYGGNVDKSGELKIEFAVVDYTLSESMSIRSGIILLPIGRFNLYHDSPVNDFTERPLVDRYIIPSTFMESGAGIFGTLYPSGNSVLGYELYIVNGIDSAPVNGGVRSARPDLKSDANKAKSIVGRVSYSPFLGLDLGGSLYTGRWDTAAESAGSALGISIAAFDWSYTMGALQLIGEVARTSYDVTAAVQGTGLGGYGQLNYHFGYGLIKSNPESVFTASIRIGQIDFNEHAGDNDGSDQRRISLGLNFRPVERTAYKLSYLWNVKRDHGATSYSGDDGFSQIRASVATYF